MSDGDPRIVRSGAERIDEYEPFYRALHDHHLEIRPRLAGVPARDADESWARRRERYLGWLAQPEAFALLAERGVEPVGFALVTVEDGFDSWGDEGPVGEIHDIAVARSERGAGVGGLLLDRAREELAAAGVSHYRLTVLGGNDGAQRFYERQGMETVIHQLMGPTG